MTKDSISSAARAARLQEQVESLGDAMSTTLERGKLRILIVGAGIAGSTLAALLKRRGEAPVLIEKQPAGASGGYMLGLLPLGGRVLHGLGLHNAYLAASRAMNAYEFFGLSGRLLRRYPLKKIVERFGAYQAIERSDLLDLLHSSFGDLPVHYGTTIVGLSQTAEGVEVTFHDGSCQLFDLVVAADGMHSSVRGLVFKPKDYETYQTGWGGWVMWTDAQSTLSDTYRELWNAGWGIGLYPVKGRTGVFLAGDEKLLKSTSPEAYITELRSRLGRHYSPFSDALDQLTPESDPFYWAMKDGRSKTWSKGRVLLLGDAATAFLPTAGVGASMAMDSAAALADELSRTDAAGIGRVLTLYEKRQRHRVEAAQENSRDLARMMFVNRPFLAGLRNALMPFYTLKMLLKNIEKVMEGD